MFGHHKRKRERRQIAKEKESLEHERSLFESQKPAQEEANRIANEGQISRATEEANRARNKAYEEGGQRFEKLYAQNQEGLTRPQRYAYKTEANKQIRGEYQRANRKLLADQSSRGIVGKGGVGYAQQRDLQRLAQEAHGQSRRDIEKLNADLALKKLAARISSEQGEAATRQIDRQLAQDQLQHAEEKRRQRIQENYYHQLFNKL